MQSVRDTMNLLQYHARPASNGLGSSWLGHVPGLHGLGLGQLEKWDVWTPNLYINSLARALCASLRGPVLLFSQTALQGPERHSSTSRFMFPESLCNSGNWQLPPSFRNGAVMNIVPGLSVSASLATSLLSTFLPGPSISERGFVGSAKGKNSPDLCRWISAGESQAPAAVPGTRLRTNPQEKDFPNQQTRGCPPRC